MKLNRKQLRRMILTEIKNLKELNYEPGNTRERKPKIFQTEAEDWIEAFRKNGIELPKSAVFLRDYAWGDGRQYRGCYGLPNHMSQSGYELFADDLFNQRDAIAAMEKRVAKENDWLMF